MSDFYKIALKIDELIISVNHDKKIYSYITLHDNYNLKHYFIYYLNKLKNNINWLQPLYEINFLKSTNQKQPVLNIDKNYTTPFWDVLDYLNTISEQNHKENNNEITCTLINIIEDLINFPLNANSFQNPRNDWMILKIIFNLPPEKLKIEFISYIEKALKNIYDTSLISGEIEQSILPRLISAQRKDLIIKLFEIILKYDYTKSQHRKIKPIMETYWLLESINKNKTKLAELCGLEIADLAEKTIKKIITNDQYIYGIRFLGKPRGDYMNHFEWIIVYLLEDMLMLTYDSQPENVKNNIIKYLKEDTQPAIFKETALRIINKFYDNLNPIFWSAWKTYLEEKSEVQDEAMIVIKENICKSQERIKDLIKWVEDKELPEEIKTDKVKIASFRLHYLQMLEKCENQDVKNIINKFKQECTGKLIPLHYDMPEVMWGESSPLTTKEIMEMSNLDLYSYISKCNLQAEDFGTPSKDGLANTFKNSIIENPVKFFNDLSPFSNLSLLFQNAIISGFEDAWRKGKELGWGNILEYIITILDFKNKKSAFWLENIIVKRANYKQWIISSITRTIEQGTEKNDAKSIPQEEMPKAKGILLSLLEVAESHIFAEDGTIYGGCLTGAVINSPRGQIYESLITYSLYAARNNPQKNDIIARWDEKIQNIFTQRLERKIDPEPDFSLILGMYLPNINYLDKNWVKDNINIIFPVENEKHWEYTFIGYLSAGGTVYAEIYQLLKTNKLYEKAIKIDFKDKYANEKLVSHICIGYLWEWDDSNVENSLINKMLNNKNYNHFEEIIEFMWRMREKHLEKVKPKVISLWYMMLNILSTEEKSDKIKEIITYFNCWLSLVDKIDNKISAWLIESVKYSQIAGQRGKMGFFLNYLLQHVIKTPDLVGKIYVEMLKAGSFVFYDKKDILSLVESLYDKKEKAYADEICNLYGERGDYFLKEIHVKNQEKNND